MAVTSDAYTATDLQYVIPELWPGLIQKQLFAKATAANFFTDLSSLLTGGADIVNIPDIFTNTYSATTQSTQGAEVTTVSNAQGNTQLTVNTHSYIASIIGDKDWVQIGRQFNMANAYIEQMAGTLRTTLEAALFGLWSGLSTNAIGDTATVLSDAEIRQGINALASANFDISSDTAFFFHPYVFWVQLGAVAKYYDQSVAGPLTQPGFVRTGALGEGMPTAGFQGTLYGIPVYTSSNVVSGLQTYRNLLAHKTAFCFGTQRMASPGATMPEARIRAQVNYELRNLGTLFVTDMIYGVAEMRDAAAVLLNASSAFIGS